MVASVQQIDPVEAGKFLAEARLGARTLLDVRQDFEYAEGHLPGALHIPLPELSERLGELDRHLPLLVYCRSGMRSLAAANLLAGQGFREIMSLRGGMMAWEGAQAQGPADLGLAVLLEADTPASLIERAWGMELSLERFYNGLAAHAANPETASLFTRFAGFEEKHRRTLSEIWIRLTGGDKAGFESAVAVHLEMQTLEGGVGPQDYLELLGDPSDAAAALELAMAVEAQAMDLYLRRSATQSDPDLRRTLLLLAEEERAHLKVLGTYADGRSGL